MSFGDSIHSANTVTAATAATTAAAPMESSSSTSSSTTRCDTRTQTRTVTHKRRVSFHSMAEVCVTETALSLSLSCSSSCSGSDREANQPASAVSVSALWWTPEDYKTNKRKYRSLARRRRRGDDGTATSTAASTSNTNTETETHRGLESILDGGRFRQLALRTVEVVRREQARHLLDGVGGDASGRSIARIYKRQSLPSRIRAERLGQIDAIEAKSALASDWGEQQQQQQCECECECEPEPQDDDDCCCSCCEEEKENDDAIHAVVAVAAMSPAKPQQQQKQKQKAATKFFQRSPEQRGSFPTNLRISITNVIHRRRHAWI